MPERVLKGAIIGLGNVAVNGHLPGWCACPEVRIVAATDADPKRLKEIEKAPYAIAWSATVDDLFRRGDLDFVDIATPPASHARLIRSALERGIHVLCEKPLVTEAGDIAGLADLARGRNLALHTVHNWLKAPGARAITAALAKGAVGPVRRIEWATLRTRPAVTVATDGASNWRTDAAIAGGGILIDHGWHALYCVARWMGVEPREVAARLEIRGAGAGGIEDTATVVLTAPQVEAEIFLTWTADRRENRIAIAGRDGTLTLVGPALTLERPGRDPERTPCAPALEEGSHHPDWFGGVVEDFLASMRSANPSESANLGEASLCARLIEAAKRSSAAGGAPQSLASAPL
ncbi:MAG: Gfo/Idh/MocA family oxidoreductase [Alphaproteobacteria bacterium]